MKNFIKIKSDGTITGTKVYDADGKEIKGIKRIEIEPLDAGSPNSVIGAKLIFVGVGLDLKINVKK